MLLLKTTTTKNKKQKQNEKQNKKTFVFLRAKFRSTNNSVYSCDGEQFQWGK